MTINFSNIAALRAQASLAKAITDVARSSERLSSGMRINRASDDSAGLSVASQLNANSRIYGQAIRNANDGISALNIADGATQQMSDVLTRLKELATQSANGSFTATQRQSLNAEGQQLRLEFNRLVNTTDFNGLGLLRRQLGTMRIEVGNSSAQGGITINPSDIGTSIEGDGTFTVNYSATSSTITSFAAVTNADFNNDGYQDIVGASFGGASAEIFLNNRDGRFQSGGITTTASASTVRYVTSGDFNGDGNADIAVAYNNSGFAGTGLSVQLGNGDGTFGNKIDTTLLNSGNPRGMTVGDVTGDGKDDIVVTESATGNVKLLTNIGGGNFSESTVFSGLTAARGVAIADFNGDGRKDIIAGGSTGAVRLLTRDAGGTFSSTNLATGAGTITSIQVGDFNGDGSIDAAIAGNSGVLIASNSGGTLTAGSIIAGSSSTNNLRVGDINNDGLLDIVGVGNVAGVNAIAYTNQGNLTFQSQNLTTESFQAQDLALADFNLDGTLDIFEVSNSSGQVSLLTGNGYRTALLDSFTLLDRNSALSAIITLDRALTNVLDGRGKIGASQSRLQSALNTLESTKENVDAASSRITDIDVATESANYVAAQIRQQVATSLLGQANQQPQIILALLKDAGVRN